MRFVAVIVSNTVVSSLSGFLRYPLQFHLTGRAEAMRYLEHALRHLPEGHSGDTEIRASSFRTGAGLVAHCWLTLYMNI